MNSVANENQFSGLKAQNVPPGTVIDAIPGAKPAAQDSQAPSRLEVSWQVAAAQNVAILDSTGKAGEPGPSPLASTGQVAAAAQPATASAKTYERIISFN